MKYYITYPIGRLVEMLPFAVCGLLIAHFNILERLLKYRWYIIFISLLGIIYLLKFDIFVSIPGYGYQGLKLLIMGTILVIAFYLLPFCFVNNKINNIIVYISKKTMGVYFAHRLIITLLYVTKLNNFMHIKNGSFFLSIFVFIVTYTIIFLLSLIPSKTLKKILT